MKLKGQYKGTRKRQQWQPRTLSQIMEWNFGLPMNSLHFTESLEHDGIDVDAENERMETMPDRDKYFQSGAWLKAKDVKNGQLLLIEEFGEAKTKIGLRPYVKFKGFDNPFGLNATNFDQLIAKFGDNEKNWTGKKVKVVIVSAPNPSAGGKMQPSIRFE